MRVRVEAPGKIVLVGEYAVLDGAPAVVAAVDRGVVCQAVAAAERSVHTPDGDDRFVSAALDAVDAPPGEYRFSAWNPTSTASKAGLGGSAAATVAAIVAARALAGAPHAPDVVHPIAHRVHHAVQGSGSGIDVAASVHGGVLRFEGGAVTALDAPLPVAVFAGSSARTGPRVQQYLRLSGRDGFVQASRRAVERFAADPLGAIADARDALDAMTARAGIDYWTDGLRRIVHLAARHGGEAKPSGAGGGDSAIALFADDTARSSFVTACREAGLVVIPTRLAPGARARQE